MPDNLKRAALILGVLTLGACHSDPFGLKPEVNVTLPDKPAADAAPAGEEEGATSEDAVEEPGP